MKNKNYIVYRFINKINGKSYIGVTNRKFSTRRCEHILASTKSPKFKFHKAIKKYGVNMFDYEILCKNIPNKSEANKLEIHFIKLYNTYKKGYNMTEGGGNRGNFRHSQKTKDKIRNLKLGKKLSETHKTKISNSLSGIPKSKTHRLNVIKSITGIKKSNEEKIKMSNRMKGRFVFNKNPAAIQVNIYNSLGELKFTCKGDFEYVCTNNNLPTKALRRSYYNNGEPIYTKKITKKEIIEKNKNFIGWYAIKTR